MAALFQRQSFGRDDDHAVGGTFEPSMAVAADVFQDGVGLDAL